MYIQTLKAIRNKEVGGSLNQGGKIYMSTMSLFLFGAIKA